MTPKLTPEQVSRVREMRNAGTPVAQIAAEFDVTPTAIYLRLKPKPTVKKAATKRKAAKHAAPAAAPKPPTRKPSAKWRVERDRTDKRYVNGWVAYDGRGNGAHFPTWPEAWRFALGQASRGQSERVANLQLAFPWSAILPPAELARFAYELANHQPGATNLDLDRMIAEWRETAAEYANRGLMKARGRAS